MADLGALGLTTYEERAYRSLLDLGPSTAGNVAAESDVPQGRIYDVLSSLEARGMVRSQAASRPKRYVAVEPSVAVDRLLEEQVRELEGTIDRYESVAATIKTELETGGRGEDPFWTTAIGTHDTLELLFERVEVAEEEIVMIADAVPPPLDLGEVGADLLDRLAEAIDRGVDVSLLVSRDILADIPAALFNRAASGPFVSQGFSVRTTDRLHGSLYLLDREEVCFPVVSPMERDRVLGLVNLKDPTFGRELDQQFRDHWDAASIVDPQEQ